MIQHKMGIALVLYAIFLNPGVYSKSNYCSTNCNIKNEQYSCRQNAVNTAQNYSDFLSAASKCKSSSSSSNDAQFNPYHQSEPSGNYDNISAFSG